MKHATIQDLYDALSYRDWKTKTEMISELENKGLDVSRYFTKTAYSHLREWEKEKLVRSQERQLSPELLRIRGGRPSVEYLRISTGIPVKLQERAGGLEGKLVKA